MLRLADLLTRFRRDDKGVVAIIFALSVVFLMGVAGLAVDSSRRLLVSQKTGDLLDSTAMMAAKLLDSAELSDSQIKERAKAYFDSQADVFAAQKEVAYSNFETIPDRKEHSVEVKVDVVMPTTLGKVVNINEMRFNRASSVIYKSRKLEIAMVLDITGSMCEPCTKIEGLRAAAKDMVETLYGNNPGKDAVRVSLVPYAASVNAGSYLSAATGGASGGPCVAEREGADATTDSAPGPGSYSLVASANLNPRYQCPMDVVRPLEDLRKSDDRNAFKQKIDQLMTDGWTGGHIGLAWGWYTLSPNWSSIWPGDAKPRNYDNEENIKAVILMTDGIFNIAYTGDNKDSESSDADGSSGNQALALCSAMRAQGIRLYTISYQAPEPAESMLQACAGDTNNAYVADNSGELIMSFRDIVDKLQMMRISK